MYSASAVDKATEICFFDDQETKERPSKWHPPDVLLRSTRHPAKSESEYPKRVKLAPLGVPQAYAWGVLEIPKDPIHSREV